MLQWLCHKSLKVNEQKTEVLLISTNIQQLSRKLSNSCPTLQIGDHNVTLSKVVGNISVIITLLQAHWSGISV